MAVLIQAPLTIDEFSRLSREGERHEMSAGELLTTAPHRFSHYVVATKLFRLLITALDKSEVGDVFAEAGYVLSRKPLTIRQPDLSVLSRQRIGSTREGQYAEGAPEFAIEIVSPSDSAQEMLLKVDQYLRAGARQVWIVYPEIRSVNVFFCDGPTVMLNDTQTLTGGDLIPGFSVLVADLFV